MLLRQTGQRLSRYAANVCTSTGQEGAEGAGCWYYSLTVFLMKLSSGSLSAIVVCLIDNDAYTQC